MRDAPGRRATSVRVHIACAAVAALGLALAAVFPLNNNDTYGHLAQGRQILASGGVPSLDPFSFWRPEPQPWHNYEWLSDVVYQLIWQLGGAIALQLFTMAVLAATAVALVQRARRPSAVASVVCAALIVAELTVIRPRLSVRPHVLGIAMAALLLLGLDRLATLDAEERGAVRRWIGGLALAHVVWVNLHGSHLFGFAVTGLYLLAHARDPVRRRWFGALLGGELLASCATPFGPWVLVDAVEHVVDPRYRLVIGEWGGWTGDEGPRVIGGVALMLGLLAAAVGPLFRGGPRGRAALCVGALLAVMTVRSVRFFAELVLLAAPAVAIGIAARLERWPDGRAIRGVAASGVALSALGIGLWAVDPAAIPFGLGETDRRLPVAPGQVLVERARTHHLLASIQDAWYLMYVDPRLRVLVDGRAPFYGPVHVAEMADALVTPARFDRVTARWHVDAVVVEHALGDHGPVLAHLEARDDWWLASVGDRHALYLSGPADRAPFERVGPAYDPRTALATDADLPALERDLERLRAVRGTRGMVAWLEGTRALRPLARDEGRAGLREPETDAEHAALEEASERLAVAVQIVPDVPVVMAYRAMVAVKRCELDVAEDALELAEYEQPSRETLLTRAEIAVRRGDEETVRAFLSGAAQMDPAGLDAWVAAVRDEHARGVRCP